ncbi:hypothetical protein ACFQIA_13865 [Halalkalicoccus sp. GCM10025704]
MSAKQHHSQVGPERGDNTHPDTADRMENSVPATIEIDLGIDPVAYQYESWSEMADEWVTSLRSTAETMPNPNHDQIRNVTPLVPLSDVEAQLNGWYCPEKSIWLPTVSTPQKARPRHNCRCQGFAVSYHGKRLAERLTQDNGTEGTIATNRNSLHHYNSI